jgi:hypothetical protein
MDTATIKAGLVLVICAIILISGSVSVFAASLAVNNKPNDYIAYARYNQTGLPLSQDSNNPTDIWENDIL